MCESPPLPWLVVVEENGRERLVEQDELVVVVGCGIVGQREGWWGRGGWAYWWEVGGGRWGPAPASLQTTKDKKKTIEIQNVTVVKKCVWEKLLFRTDLDVFGMSLFLKKIVKLISMVKKKTTFLNYGIKYIIIANKNPK